MSIRQAHEIIIEVRNEKFRVTMEGNDVFQCSSIEEAEFVKRRLEMLADEVNLSMILISGITTVKKWIGDRQERLQLVDQSGNLEEISSSSIDTSCPVCHGNDASLVEDFDDGVTEFLCVSNGVKFYRDVPDLPS